MRSTTRWALLVCVLVAALGAVAPAQAHTIWHKKHLTHQQRIYYVRLVMRHSKSVLYACNHATCSRALVRNHLWLYKTFERKLARELAAERPAHFAGWWCIHHGASPGAPHEGNGTSPNGLYSGPLQMTSTWEGYSYAWNALPMMTVFRIAERVAASHGFSYSWMKHQWPRTFPPCASFF